MSINLFLWFKPDWFVLQFGLVALGLAANRFTAYAAAAMGTADHLRTVSEGEEAACCGVVAVEIDAPARTGLGGFFGERAYWDSHFDTPDVFLFID